MLIPAILIGYIYYKFLEIVIYKSMVLELESIIVNEIQSYANRKQSCA